MMKQLLIFAIVAGAVLADINHYRCDKPGSVFECFESSGDSRFCLTDGSNHQVICGKCRKEYEYCKNHLKASKRPEHDCGAGYEHTPCTDAMRHVPSHL